MKPLHDIDLEQKLIEYSKLSGMSKDEIINKAINYYLNTKQTKLSDLSN